MSCASWASSLGTRAEAVGGNGLCSSKRAGLRLTTGSRRSPAARSLRGLLRAPLLLALASAAAGTVWTPLGEAAAFSFPAWRNRGEKQAVAAVSAKSSEAPSVETETDSGRVVRVETERVQDVDLSGATVKWMDELMQDRAVEVLAAGAERAEKAPGGGDLWYAYMKPQRMGPWTNQMRLTCQMRLEDSHAVHVDVVAFDVGTPDEKTGEMVFKKYEEDSFSLKWANSIQWRQQGDGLKVSHTSFGTLRMALPWWFPLPDSLVKATVNAGTQWMLRDGRTAS